MTNSELLRQFVKAKGISYKHIANEMGLTTAGLYKKINNQSEFKVSEVTSFCNAVGGMSRTEQRAIFFAHEVDC